MVIETRRQQRGRGAQPWRRRLQQLAPLLVGVAILLAATALVDRVQPPLPAPIPVSAATLDDRPAPPFQLADQDGAAVSLAALRGRVVVLTFLYTGCPDICPVTLGKFGIAARMLGARADDVAFLAITVDPARDDPVRVRHYLDTLGLSGAVRFLTADEATLAPVWSAYQITVARGPTASDASRGYEVVHSDRVYLIDRDGCLRRMARSTTPPQELLVDIVGLLGESRLVEGATCG